MHHQLLLVCLNLISLTRHHHRQNHFCSLYLLGPARISSEIGKLESHVTDTNWLENILSPIFLLFVPEVGAWNQFQFRLRFAIYIYPTPPPPLGRDTRSVIKPSSTGLTSEFFFSLTGCHTKVKKPSLANYLLEGE